VPHPCPVAYNTASSGVSMFHLKSCYFPRILHPL
jgi:hypothetical protein